MRKILGVRVLGDCGCGVRLAACVFGLVICNAFAITPNKLVSGGVPAYAGGSTTDYLTDGFLTNWKYSAAKDIAMKVGEGPTKLRINWESYGDCAWATDFTTGCGHSGTPLANFKIMTSANSTDGVDGDWVETAKVENNPVMARGVDIDFAGKSWFRIVSDGDVGQILEIEAFDMSAGGTDTWFFMGTSISQMGIKQQDTDSTTAQIIHAKYPEFTPAMLRGGIGCINSSEVVAHLSDYLKYAGNVRYWAIEMGTNDAWGGGDWNLQTYVDNMQTIIDSAKAHDITPVIARIIATNPAKATWQINPKFLTAVDSLVKVNELPAGPDFYSYFEKHPELLGDDGVHPNAQTGGGQAMHHLWAEALAPLYADKSGNAAESSSATSVSSSSVNGAGASSGGNVAASSSSQANVDAISPHSATAVNFAMPRVAVNGRNIAISNVGQAQVDIVSLLGQVLDTHQVANASAGSVQFKMQVPAGDYFVLVREAGKSMTVKISVK